MQVHAVVSARSVLLLAAGLFAFPCVADTTGASSVRVVVSDYRYEPATIALHANAPVELVLVNGSVHEHNLSAPSFFQTVQMQDAGDLRNGQVVLRPGQTKTLTFVPKRSGTFSFECTMQGHAAMGMKGQIEVQ